jgi:hypothetical protein
MTPRPKKEPLLCARNNATAFVAAISNPEITRIEEVRRSHEFVIERALAGSARNGFTKLLPRRRLAQLRLAIAPRLEFTRKHGEGGKTRNRGIFARY